MMETPQSRTTILQFIAAAVIQAYGTEARYTQTRSDTKLLQLIAARLILTTGNTRQFSLVSDYDVLAAWKSGIAAQQLVTNTVPYPSLSDTELLQVIAGTIGVDGTETPYPSTSERVLLSAIVCSIVSPADGTVTQLVQHGPPDPITKFGSALVAWFDPWDSATITQSGGLVSAWANKAGPGNFSASGTQRPTYSATAIQGNAPGITFNGSTNILIASGVAPGAVSSMSFFMLTECDNNHDGGDQHELATYVANGDGGFYAAHSANFLYGEPFRGTIGAQAFGVNSEHSNWFGVPQQGIQPPQGKQTVRMGSTWDGTNQTFYLDNRAAPGVANTGALVSPGSLVIGNRADGANAGWTGAVGEIIMLNRAATSDERDYLQSWFTRKYARILVPDGDSTVHGAVPGSPFTEDGYVRRHAANASKLTFVNNIAIGGSSLDSDNTDEAMVYRASLGYANRIPANKYGQEYVYYAYICNNIGGLTNTASGYAATWVTYMAARRAEGYDKVVMATILDRTDAGQNETVRHAFNAIIKNPNWTGLVRNGGPVDMVIDFASHPIMGVDNAPTVNAAYFEDEVHPNSSGYGLLEVDTFTPGMNALS